jgi:putative hydrolase of the HAD superfamily
VNTIPTSPLVLFDLDNTLVDRGGAFRRWAQAFLAERALDPEELAWLEREDRDGALARPAFFGLVQARYRLEEQVEDLVAAYLTGVPRLVQPAGKETLAALTCLRVSEFRIGIATNGAPSQEEKIVRAGLADAVDGWAISEVVGSRKPEPAIFEAAAAACGSTLRADTWMVGDSAEADIAGAVNLGLRSVWVSHGRRWDGADFHPDLVVASIPEAVAHIVGAQDPAPSSH